MIALHGIIIYGRGFLGPHKLEQGKGDYLFFLRENLRSDHFKKRNHLQMSLVHIDPTASACGDIGKEGYDLVKYS